MKAPRLKQFANRLTGVSIPFGGAQWNPPTAEREGAKNLILFLEDRRVLYNPYYAETPSHCIESIIEIRRYLVSLSQELGDTSLLKKHVRAMAAGARELLDRLKVDDDFAENWHFRGMGGSMDFQDALGRLRAGYGQHLAFIAERFDLKIPKDLRSILPPAVTDED